MCRGPLFHVERWSVDHVRWGDEGVAHHGGGAPGRLGLAGRYLARLGGITTDDMGGVWLTMLGQKNGIGVDIPGDPHIRGRVMPLADDEAPRGMNTHAEVVEPTGALAEVEGDLEAGDADN